jgi:hypothetical protein
MPLLLVLVLGCDSSPTADETINDPVVPEGLGIAQTDSPTSPVVFIHSEGTRLTPVLDPETGALSSASVEDSEGNRMGIVFNEETLPSMVVVGDLLMLFRNYTETSVDLAFLDEEGSIEIIREVDLSPLREQMNTMTALDTNAQLHAKTTDWLALTNAIVQPLGVAGAIITAGVAVSTAATSPAWVAAAAVGGAIVSMTTIAISNTDWIDAAVGKFSAISDAIACGVTPISCVTAGISQASSMLALITALQRERAEDLNAAQAGLETAPGDIQVTLTWSTEGDVDLHLFEPSGFEIYYGDPASPSGGVLSDDNTEGFGPENISWPEATPQEGNYRVAVNYYEGVVPTSYTVIVQSGGQTSTYRGILQPYEWADVVTFETGRPLSNLAGSSRGRHDPLGNRVNLPGKE